MSATVHKKKYAHCQSPSQLRAELEREGYSAFAWSDSPGAFYPDHSHPHDEYIVVASGQIVFMIDGERFSLNDGDALELPANTVHAAKNEDRQAVSYFICTK